MDDESGGYSVGRRKVKISRRTSAESLSILTLGVDLIANALMLFSIDSSPSRSPIFRAWLADLESNPPEDISNLNTVG